MNKYAVILSEGPDSKLKYFFTFECDGGQKKLAPISSRLAKKKDLNISTLSVL